MNYQIMLTWSKPEIGNVHDTAIGLIKKILSFDDFSLKNFVNYSEVSII